MSYSYSSQSFNEGDNANLFAFSGTSSSSHGSQADQANSVQVNQIAQDLLALNGGSGRSAAVQYSSGFSSGAAAAGGASYGLASSGAIGSGNYVSEVENQILRAQQPIQINETEEISVNGERGIWANRAEVVNWRGQIPIEQYVINQDTNPEIITKRTTQQLEYLQELAIRYLRPPT
jgi:hypothetical protein